MSSKTYVSAIPRTDSQVMQAGGYSNELYLSYLFTLCRFSCSFAFPISTKCFRYWCAKTDTWRFDHSQYISTQHSLFQCHEQVTLITSSILLASYPGLLDPVFVAHVSTASDKRWCEKAWVRG